MSDKNPSHPGDRLAKVIARAGVCSRRDAENWIAAGRVAVNGGVVRTAAFNVVESDTIDVDGKPIARKQATQLWLYHKPAGLMVTEKDPEGRPTVFDAFAGLGLPRVLTVGRLDYNTEGLLLLTNDGGLKRTLELPATGWVRRYRVRAFGSVTQEQLDTLAKGVTVEGVDYGPIEAVLDSTTGSNVWITVGLREGKNREVRNVLGALGLEVNRLIRLSYGPFQLGDLPSGHAEKVKPRILKDQLGKRLAEEAGADFSAPIDEEEGQPRRRAPQNESRPTERDRYTGLRKRPDFKRPERREAAPRTVHFDDGRPSQTFVPQGDPKRGRDGDFKSREEDGFKKRFDSDRPRRDDRPKFERRDGSSGSKPFADKRRADGDARPYRGKPTGEGRPFRKDEDRPFARRSAPGKGDKTFGDRPPRRDGGKPFGDKRRADGDARPYRDKPSGEGRPFRKDEDRPFARRSAPGKGDKAFGDRPPRRDGDKPFSKGPRREGGSSNRPFSNGPRRESAPGERSFSKGPRREGGDRPFAKGPRREDGGGERSFSKAPRRDVRPSDKPFAKGPRKPFGGDGPSGSRPPRRDAKPSTGPRPDRPRRPKRPEDE